MVAPFISYLTLWATGAAFIISVMDTAKPMPLWTLSELVTAEHDLAVSEKELEWLRAEIMSIEPVPLRRGVRTFRTLARLRRAFGQHGPEYSQTRDHALRQWPEMELALSIAERSDMLAAQIEAVRRRCGELRSQIDDYERRTVRH
jgi:hypothetical protein